MDSLAFSLFHFPLDQGFGCSGSLGKLLFLVSLPWSQTDHFHHLILPVLVEVDPQVLETVVEGFRHQEGFVFLVFSWFSPFCSSCLRLKEKMKKERIKETL